MSEDAVKEFLSRISIEHVTEEFLQKEIIGKLFLDFNVNAGTEHLFLKSLFYHVFEWSKDRADVTSSDISILIQSVKDSFSRFPSNPALQNNWIAAISYDPLTADVDEEYYNGKAARPADIAKGLPVKRPEWEKKISDSVFKFDVSLIKSSSGQGKSTLAWQVGYLFASANYSLYQVHHCNSWDSATSIKDFIDSRIQVGQTPVIIIDGLNPAVNEWYQLAELLRDKPVKVIITAREEDWIRHSGNISRISLNIVDIKLLISEAKHIFLELKKNNKIHSAITSWEPAWEKINAKGLLIEYVYLLTKGQMLQERLQDQVQLLTKEIDGAAKTEILRLIAVGDILNVKLETAKLTKYVQKHITFTGDRNEIYRQLEKEYYLKFDNNFIEGLHPVRSKHLVDILHSHISVADSLSALLIILNEDYIYEYFIGAPFLLDAASKGRFYKDAAAMMAGATFPVMVAAIDGLMHYEPYNYWIENKEIFDQAYLSGGLNLFIADSIPFSKLNTLQELLKGLDAESGSNIKHLLELKQKLTAYTFSNSDIISFISYLQASLKSRGKPENLDGIAFLYKWFKRVNIPFPEIAEVNPDELLRILKDRDITESSDLFHFFSLFKPVAYRSFIDKNRDEIFSLIKKKTKSPTIYEVGADIHINYLLDDETTAIANEHSVNLIDTLYAFFPFYTHYCTDGIILPFPTEDIWQASLQNAHKAIPAENLWDNFDVHINQIWMKTIEDRYAAESSYEWQKQYIEVRGKFIELSKVITRLLEAHLEKNQSRIRSLTRSYITLGTEVLKMDQLLKVFPSSSRKYFEPRPFKEQTNQINECFSSLRNFINQFSGLILPKSEHNRNLPIINIKSTVYKLPSMQAAFEKISNEAQKYFPTDLIIKEESDLYPRLSQTAQYYVHYNKNKSQETVVVVSKNIAQWQKADQEKRLKELKSIVTELETQSEFQFILPNRVIEDENLNYAVIGVLNCDISDTDNFTMLSIGLTGLIETDIQYLTLVFINDDKVASHAIRVSQSYFEKIRELLNSGEPKNDGLGLPLPVALTPKLIETLEDIGLKEIIPIKEDEVFFRMVINIWKLSEYRNRLNLNSGTEQHWLAEIEEEYKKVIEPDCDFVYADSRYEIIPARELVDEFLKRNAKVSKEEMLSWLLERVTQMNFVLSTS